MHFTHIVRENESFIASKPMNSIKDPTEHLLSMLNLKIEEKDQDTLVNGFVQTKD